MKNKRLRCSDRLAGPFPVVLAWILCLSTAASVYSAVPKAESAASATCEDNGDGECLDCGLYLAESTLRPGHWGLYSGRDSRKGESISPQHEVAINLIDFTSDEVDNNDSVQLLKRFVWDAYHTSSTYDATQVDTLIPGLGFWTQAHPDLFNLHNEGPIDRNRIAPSNATAGAFSHLQQIDFTATRAISAGQELLLDPSELSDLRAPTTPASLDATTATPHVQRSMEWLQQHGRCVDHLEVHSSQQVAHQYGAFVRRGPIRRGQRISSSPVVPLLKEHLKLPLQTLPSELRQSPVYQLLLNYCYGHVDSSLLLLPTAPAINLINHASPGTKANVALRWSAELPSTWAEQSPQQIVQLALHEPPELLPLVELYALDDLQVGEEILLDYGAAWETAWQHHENFWQPQHLLLFRQQGTSRPYRSPYEYELMDTIPTMDEPFDYPSSNIQTRCWIDVERILDEQPDSDDEGWYTFIMTEGTLIDWTTPCEVVSAEYDSYTGEKTFYNVVLQIDDDDEDEDETMEVKVKRVPWDAITFVDAPYQGHQFSKQSFRHEIQVPEELFPIRWKDLAPPPAQPCGLYMAESAIPHSGMGMYSAKPIAAGERIFYGDAVVQVKDYEVNNRLRRHLHQTSNETPADGWLLNSYFWNPSMTRAHYEALDIQSIVPGLGMLANSHPGLVNAELQAPVQTTSLHRAFDVGAGASTTYHDVNFYAPKPIQEGEEIFVRYGDAWFVERTDLGKVPLESDFVKADVILHKFWRITKGNSQAPMASDVWNMVERIAANGRKRLAAALPKLDQVEHVVEAGTASHSTPNRFRSAQWLEQNGRCLDNVRPGDSTLVQAGKGAFATRPISQGSVIAPMPVVQILRRDLEIYQSHYAPGEDGVYDHEEARRHIRFLGMQQLINYCYGHPNSSLLLFPYSPVVNYVNHNSTLVNARLRWSDVPGHRREWLQRSPTEIVGNSHAGLVMELVALREIKAGEEIFLNYGSEWDAQWKEHVIDWFPPEDGGSYVPAFVLNRRAEWLRTEEELERDPYPFENAFTACYVGRTRRKWRPNDDEDEDEEDDHEFEYEWTFRDGMYDDTDNLFPCDVLDRDTGASGVKEARGRAGSVAPLPVLYTVRIEGGSDDDSHDDEPLIFHGVPREAIRFFDAQYSSDLFLRGAFRREIQLPVEMVPEAWKDL